MQVGEIYENPVTGEHMEVLEATDDALVLDFRVEPGGAVPIPHVHPSFTETFAVLEGELSLRVGRDVSVVRPGERSVVPPGVAHAWWNAGESPARMRLEIHPPGRFADMISTMFQLARDGETDATGKPSPLQLVMTARELRDCVHAASPPLPLQRVGLALLAPLARLRGYEGLRPYRHDVPASG